MAKLSLPDLKDLIVYKIFQNTYNKIRGQDLQDVLIDMADSLYDENQIETSSTDTITFTGDGTTSTPLTASVIDAGNMIFTVGRNVQTSKSIIDRIKYGGAEVQYFIKRGPASRLGVLKITFDENEFIECNVVGGNVGVQFFYNFSANMLQISVDDHSNYSAEITFKMSFFV